MENKHFFTILQRLVAVNACAGTAPSGSKAKRFMARILRFRQKLKQAVLFGALGFTTIGMNGCDAMYWDEQESLAAVKSQGDLIVLTTENPLIYSENKKGEASGIDHELLENFAGHYNLKLKYVTLTDEQAILQALSTGQGDIAAARLRTSHNSEGFLTGPSYEETTLSLYCHKQAQVQNIRDLNNKKVTLLEQDNYQGLVERLLQFSPLVRLEIISGQKTLKMMAQLNESKKDCVIAETLNGDYYSRSFSQVEKVITLTDSYSLSWLLPPNNQHLVRLMQSWYQQATRDDEIMRVLDRHKTYLSQLNKRDITQFLKRVRSTFPTYRKAFKEAADEHDLPWQLVASVAYQESHWNAEARSYTGVRGIMQLTEDTAAHVGVEDRTDPMQSIWGGSKYLRYLFDQTPKGLNAKDRMALALAAYNIGWAHLKDAQKLAEKMGRNPYSWRHLREILPLLANPEYSSDLEYGAARGYETVDFVERVTSFYNLMSYAK